MKKYSVLLLLGLLSSSLCSQNYIELVKISSGNVFKAGFENSDETTNVSTLDAALTYPVKLNEKFAFITGLDYGQYKLDLLPGGDRFSLNYLRLKAGVNYKHSNRWSGTYLLLPKVASQDLEFSENSFFLGALALLKYQKNERFQYRLGAYASGEGFGVLATPILGLYYLNESNNFEATLNLPINGDMNYTFNKTIGVGFAFEAPVRSFRLQNLEDESEKYIQSNVIDAGFYLQYSFLNKSILFRLQGGYSSVSYEVYEKEDTLPFRLSAFEFGDDRNLINPEMNGNLFARVTLIYRFNLNDVDAK